MPNTGVRVQIPPPTPVRPGNIRYRASLVFLQGVMMIKAVFFDVGSTLIYANPDIDGVFHECATARGHNLTPEKIAQHMPEVLNFYEAEYLRDGDFWCSPEGSAEMYLDMYRYLAHLCNVAHDAEGIAQAVHSSYLTGNCWRAYDDVRPALKMLKADHLRLGIISNWSSNLDTLLREIKIRPYFEEVIASADVGYRKPDPVIFELMLERMGVSPEEAVHVGDRIDADAKGAVAAGISPIIIDREGGLTDKRYATVESLLDLPKALARISGSL